MKQSSSFWNLLSPCIACIACIAELDNWAKLSWVSNESTIAIYLVVLLLNRKVTDIILLVSCTCCLSKPSRTTIYAEETDSWKLNLEILMTIKLMFINLGSFIHVCFYNEESHQLILSQERTRMNVVETEAPADTLRDEQKSLR